MEVHILKETYNGLQRVGVRDELFKRRVIFFTCDVTPETTDELISQLLILESDDPGETITLCINSPGGSVDSGLAVCDVIRGITSPVNTVCTGVAASMGAVIFLQGKERTMFPHARFMIHDPSYAGGDLAGRKPLSLKEDFEELMGVRQRIAEIISERTGRTLDEVLENTKDDHFMTAKEALKFGAATKIGIFTLPVLEH